MKSENPICVAIGKDKNLNLQSKSGGFYYTSIDIFCFPWKVENKLLMKWAQLQQSSNKM